MKQEITIAAKASVHDTLSAINRPLAEWRFQRAIKNAQGPILVSAGAGSRNLNGWLNTDISWRANLYLDLTKPWPIPSGTVARIFADNVIEHFSLKTGRKVFRCAFDVLQADGVIRLATPDVERTVLAYLNDPALTAQHLDRHRRVGYDVHHAVDLLRVTFSECGHHLGFCYDLNSLTTELQRVGFVDVKRVQPGQSEDPLLKNLEARMEPSEAATSLVVEARRPRSC